jgi:hypothetical protein
MATSKIKIQQKQTIWDLAIQGYGSLEGALYLNKENPAINFNTLPTPGTIALLKSAQLNKDVVNFFAARESKPATGSPTLLATGDFSNDFNNDFN